MRYEPYTDELGKLYARLDISDLAFPEEYQDVLGDGPKFFVGDYFNQKSVNITQSKQQDVWNNMMTIPNQFLAELTPEESQQWLNYLLQVQVAINGFCMQHTHEAPRHQLNQFMLQLSQGLLDFDTAFGLCTKIDQFRAKHVHTGMLEEAGSRPQDVPEMTFYPQEVDELLSIVVTCKLMVPVFGMLIQWLSVLLPKPVMLRDQQLIKVLLAYLQRHHQSVINKLQHYTLTNTSKVFKQDADDLSLDIAGYDITLITDNTIITLLVRRFVVFETDRDDSQLMRYIYHTIVRNVRTINSSIKRSTPCRARIMVGAETKTNVSDDSNIAQIEIDSAISEESLESIAMVNAAVQRIVNKTRQAYGLSQERFDECYRWYLANGIPAPSLLSLQVVEWLFGEELGGCASLRYLHAEQYLALLVQAQLILENYAPETHSFLPLIHALSMKQMSELDELSVPETTAQAMQATSHPYYSENRDFFANSCYPHLDELWMRRMRELAIRLCGCTYHYHTAPVLWPEDNRNGFQVEITDQILGGLSQLLVYRRREEASC